MEGLEGRKRKLNKNRGNEKIKERNIHKGALEKM